MAIIRHTLEFWQTLLWFLKIWPFPIKIFISILSTPSSFILQHQVFCCIVVLVNSFLFFHFGHIIQLTFPKLIITSHTKHLHSFSPVSQNTLCISKSNCFSLLCWMIPFTKLCTSVYFICILSQTSGSLS